MTDWQMILDILSDGKPRCLSAISEEIKTRFDRKVMDSTISARTRDVLKNKIVGIRPEGKSYKVWFIPAPAQYKYEGQQGVLI